MDATNTTKSYKSVSCKRELREEEQDEVEKKSSVYMYNVNFSRIRGLCRLFHYYFLFIFLISKETKLLCMWNPLIAMQMTLHGKQTPKQKRCENDGSFQKQKKKSSHIHAKTNEKKYDQKVSPSLTHTLELMSHTKSTNSRSTQTFTHV